MKKCQCNNCGRRFKVQAGNVKCEVKDEGYKYPKEHYYAKCPACKLWHEISFTDLPFKIKWQLFKEKCLGD